MLKILFISQHEVNHVIIPQLLESKSFGSSSENCRHFFVQIVIDIILFVPKTSMSIFSFTFFLFRPSIRLVN